MQLPRPMALHRYWPQPVSKGFNTEGSPEVSGRDIAENLRYRKHTSRRSSPRQRHRKVIGDFLRREHQVEIEVARGCRLEGKNGDTARRDVFGVVNSQWLGGIRRWLKASVQKGNKQSQKQDVTDCHLTLFPTHTCEACEIPKLVNITCSRFCRNRVEASPEQSSFNLLSFMLTMFSLIRVL